MKAPQAAPQELEGPAGPSGVQVLGPGAAGSGNSRSAPDTPTGPSRARRDAALVAGLVLLATALRTPTLGRSYWIDEAISIGISSHPVAKLPGLLRRDGSPPLFYVLLHFWMRAFGRSEVATHMLPLLISLACVPAGYWAARQMFDRRAGLAAAALFATNPFLNWYGTETRMYTLVVLLATVAVTFAFRAVERRRIADAAGAVLGFTALLYTHDWGIYLTAATALVLAVTARRRHDRVLLAWVLAAGTTVLLLWLPWLPSFLYQAGNTAAPWAVRPLVTDIFADTSTAMAGTLGIVVVPFLAGSALLLRRSLDPAGRRRAGLLALVSVTTTALGYIGALVQPSWTVRYLAVLVAPYLLATAGVLSPLWRGRQALVVACSVLTAWAVAGALLPNPGASFAKDNMAAVAAAARPYLSAGGLVIVTQTEQVPVAYHYLPSGLRYETPTGPVADPSVVDWRHIVSRLEAAQPCRDVAPAIDALPVGAIVVEINPVRSLGADGTAWSRAVNGQVVSVGAFLSSDRGLSFRAVLEPDIQPRPYSPVEAVVYQKTSTTASCP